MNDFKKSKKERAVYLSMKQQLLKDHEGGFAAFYNGKFVAVADSKQEVMKKVREKLGQIAAFIQKVEREEPIFREPCSRHLSGLTGWKGDKNG